MRVCKHCGVEIKTGAVKDNGLFFHYSCIGPYYGISVTIN